MRDRTGAHADDVSGLQPCAGRTGRCGGPVMTGRPPRAAYPPTV